jgi:c-di-GMP-binding flagellar brake protein YcgR
MIQKLLKLLRRVVRPRLHPRYYVDKGVVVVVEPYTMEGKKVQILDIGEGGCAFIYNGSKDELEESGILSLRLNDIPYLDRVDFATKSDILISNGNNKTEQFRRRGVEFKWLGVVDKKKLKEFIKKNFIAPVS